MINKIIKMISNKLANRNDLLEYLKSNKIEYSLIEHPKVMTVDDMKEHIKLEKSEFFKNLFFSDKKGNFYLIIAHHETDVKREFWKTIGTTYNNVRMGKEESLKEILNVKKGCVNPFAVINDTNKKVKLILDENMKNHSYFSFHPLDNEATVEIQSEEFFKYLDLIEKKFEYVNLSVDKVEVPKKEVPNKKQKVEENILKIECKKEENFAKWYTEIIKKSEMIEYYDVSGCYILRQNSFFIWECVQRFLDNQFKLLNVNNVCFPMFVTASKLEKEKDHLEGFSAEVAWVTHSGKSKLNEPIAIRPTSETIMYPAFSKWIRSHRDLPLLLNQWTNVVRWEFKNPTPFIRTREFLWQEGHTAHENEKEATDFAFNILDKYELAYKEILCVPVVKGIKSEKEKFAGAKFTTTCETFIAENGRAIQACTSHMLGQNFSKMFEIKFENKNQKRDLVWQTSWGFTTRSIGVMTMIHADDKGLVLPPAVAFKQVVIVPIFIKNKNKKEIIELTENLFSELNKRGIRTVLDDRPSHSSGYKFNDWELKGVPIRLEIGPKDIDNKKIKLVRRVDNEKIEIEFNNDFNDFENKINENFKIIKELMYNRAKDRVFNLITIANNWEEFMVNLNNNKILKTLWCDKTECEEIIKKESGDQSKVDENDDGMSGSAKTLCKPLSQDEISENDKCFKCCEKAKTWVLWGRSY